MYAIGVIFKLLFITQEIDKEFQEARGTPIIGGLVNNA